MKYLVYVLCTHILNHAHIISIYKSDSMVTYTFIITNIHTYAFII